jgi:hypothetical protein
LTIGEPGAASVVHRSFETIPRGSELLSRTPLRRAVALKPILRFPYASDSVVERALSLVEPLPRPDEFPCRVPRLSGGPRTRGASASATASDEPAEADRPEFPRQPAFLHRSARLLVHGRGVKCFADPVKQRIAGTVEKPIGGRDESLHRLPFLLGGLSQLRPVTARVPKAFPGPQQSRHLIGVPTAELIDGPRCHRRFLRLGDTPGASRIAIGPQALRGFVAGSGELAYRHPVQLVKLRVDLL